MVHVGKYAIHGLFGIYLLLILMLFRCSSVNSVNQQYPVATDHCSAPLRFSLYDSVQPGKGEREFSSHPWQGATIFRHFNRTKCHYNVGIDNESIRNQNPKSLLSSCKVIAQQSGLLERCLGMWLWFKIERSFKKRGAWYYCHTCEYLLRLATWTARFAIVVSNHITVDLVPFLSYSTRLKISLAPMFMPMLCCTSSPKDHQLWTISSNCLSRGSMRSTSGTAAFTNLHTESDIEEQFSQWPFSAIFGFNDMLSKVNVSIQLDGHI